MHWLRVLPAALLLSPVILSAQTAPRPDNQISLDAVVTDKAGKPVSGLSQSDFTLFVDKQVTPLSYFRAVSDGSKEPPVDMVIVIDAINADVLKAEHQREGIRTFLESNGGKLPVPVSLITITDQNVSEPSAPSLDGNTVAKTLDQSVTRLRLVNRSTQYSDGERFNLSMSALDSIVKVEAPKPGKKLIVWVSPGWPMLARAQSNISTKDQQQIFEEIVRISTVLRLAHITLYNVVARGIEGTNISQFWYYTGSLNGVKTASEAFPPNLALPVLAVQTGGLVLNNSNDIASAMAREIDTAANDGRLFYMMTFQGASAEHPNEYHHIELKVNQPGLTARTRTGYYAQPAQP